MIVKLVVILLAAVLISNSIADEIEKRNGNSSGNSSYSTGDNNVQRNGIIMGDDSANGITNSTGADIVQINGNPTKDDSVQGLRNSNSTDIIVEQTDDKKVDETVKRIRDRYNNVTETCLDSENNEKPAFQCSGIMMRGVNPSLRLQFGWSMKNLHKQKNAFPLSYLRKDQVFSAFPQNYDSGFIVFPHLETPPEKNKYKVYCSFPINADGDDREGHGCGKSKGDSTQASSSCNKQNIKTIGDWKTHFKSIINSRDRNVVKKQCAFDMTIKSAANDFVISLKANNYIHNYSEDYAFRNNELRMHAWNEMNANKIPIEAFFYLIGSARGKYLAEKYKNDFYNRSGGEKVPIVGIQLPTAERGFDVIPHKESVHH